MIRRHSTPWWITSGSDVKKGMNAGAKRMKIMEMTNKKIMLKYAERHTDFSARSGLKAPKFWPTRVEAAAAIPHAGKMVKMMILIPMEYPATAASPNTAIIFMIKNQLAVAINHCSTPVEDTRINFLMMSPNHTRCLRCRWIRLLPLTRWYTW